MFTPNDSLTSLATRVRGGDLTAVASLREELEPRMTSAVRQVMRTGMSTSPLDRRILRELAGAGRSSPAGNVPDRVQLSVEVARRLCAAFIAKLRRGGPNAQLLKDTVRDL